MSFNKVLMLCILLFSSLALSDSDGWKLVRDKDGIQVYSKPVEGSSLNAVKGVTTINTSLNRLAYILLTPSIRPKWDEMCSESFLYKSLGEQQSLVYVRNAMPWPVSDRDMLSRVVWSQDQENNSIMITSRGTADLFPIKKGVVRVTEISHDWSLIPKGDGNVEVITQVHLDPAGPIPSWLINTMSVESPYDALRRLNILVNSEEIEIKKYDAISEPES